MFPLILPDHVHILNRSFIIIPVLVALQPLLANPWRGHPSLFAVWAPPDCLQTNWSNPPLAVISP
jgi:hypothetical protein